jgi:ubiquinone/menaquinone biosynthesis C-methylase UbiE
LWYRCIDPVCRQKNRLHGRIVGPDISPDTLEVARTSSANAAALPFPDEAFDIVFCQLGLMFFPDRSQALAEM